MKNLYLYIYNSNLPLCIKQESLKNVILEELFELFNTGLLIPERISPKDQVILNYTGFLFATKQKAEFKENGIEITDKSILINCTGNVNTFDYIEKLKKNLKAQLLTLL